MSTPRALTALVAALFSTGLSVNPWSAAPPPPRALALAPEPLGQCKLSCPLHPAPAKVASSGIETSDAPVPADVELEVASEARGGHRVVVRRRGFLVSLRDEEARSAGVDWTAVRVSPRPGAPQEGERGSAGRLIWETTKLDGLVTARGLVQLRGEGGSLRGELRAAAPPRSAASWTSPRATCAGQHDGLGGFTVLCRFAKGTRVSGVANVTGARSLDDAWLTPGPSPLARLDLPRSPGGAEGRVIGLTRGTAGIVLRVEAAFLEGEEPALQIQETERTQPVAR
jgi:hypothetical protein